MIARSPSFCALGRVSIDNQIAVLNAFDTFVSVLNVIQHGTSAPSPHVTNVQDSSLEEQDDEGGRILVRGLEIPGFPHEKGICRRGKIALWGKLRTGQIECACSVRQAGRNCRELVTPRAVFAVGTDWKPRKC